MFRVNDYVVYGLTGVCQIVGFSTDYIGSTENEFYVLNPVYDNNMIIKVPMNNPNLVMRTIITKEDIMSLIAAMPDMESIWIDDDKQRNAAFKAALKSGKNEEWAKLIKTLHLQKEARTVDGKKLAKIDEDIMNRAEKFLNEEFSVALDISPDEVVPFIKKHIPLNNGNPNQKVIQEWHEMDKTLTK